MTMTRTWRLAAAGAIVIAGVALPAQEPPRPQPPAQGAPAATADKPAAAGQAPSSSGYTYDPAGRRDPFVSLLGRGSDPRSAANRPSGLAGVLISEAVITGIVRGGGGFTAFLRAPDNRTYIIKGGERLLDGTVKSITEGAVVFSQDVNDPLSLVKQREIRKTARPGGESQQ